jgi:rhodanese-related sulfurtransferase
VIVDIRDPREIERDGKIPARSPPRPRHAGILDRSGQSLRKPIFQVDKKFIFHCAGGSSSRSPPRPPRTWG